MSETGLGRGVQRMRVPVAARFHGWIANHFRAFLGDKWALLLIPAFSVYVGVWSYLTSLKFYARHSSVFDFGLEMEAIWKFAHPHGVTSASYLMAVVDQPFQFLISPLSIPVSYPLLLVVQSLGLASGAFAVYGISLKVFKGRLGAFSLSLSYLLYFPMGGVNWFDFHAQAFFIPLFLWGFYCYITQRFRLAFALFIIAAGTTYLYVLLVILFSSLSLGELLLKRLLFDAKPESRELKFAGALLVTSIAFFLYQFAYETYVVGISFARNAVIVTGTIPISNRVEVLVLLLLPMMFLPALAPKWLIMLLPFSYLEFASASSAYNFPTIFQIQFTALAIPFIFIGTAYGIRFLQRLRSQQKLPTRATSEAARPNFQLRRPPRTASAFATTVFALTACSAMVLQPYGPFNSSSTDNFGTSNATELNWTYFGQYSRLESLIPSSTPYVLFQNNMPSVLPRPLDYYGAPLVPGLEHWLNATLYDASTNRFPLELVQNKVVFTPIGYAISDPNDLWYTFGGNVSMAAFFSAMYQSRYYGLIGEASGMAVLARGYVGPLQYYEPLSKTFPATELVSGATRGLSSDPVLSRSNLTGQTAWYGPYTALAPGVYRIGFSLMTSSTLPSNHLTLFVLANGATAVLARYTITGGNFSQTGAWTTIYLTAQLAGAYSDLEFAGWYGYWNGTISIRSVSVTEIAPPSSSFAGGPILLQSIPPSSPG